MKDKKLIHSLKMHKQTALLRVMECYGGYTYTIVSNILKGTMQKEDIDEVVSDVFLKLWNNAEKIDEDRALKPYLVSIARNEARNKLRQYNTIISLEQVSQEEYGRVDYSNELEDKLIMDEKLKIIKKILDASPPLDSEIFARFYYNYEKVREISVECNVSESKVKMTLSRLRKKMEQALEEQGYER